MINNISKERKPRPYWHVDAKWIAGILLFLSFSAGLMLYNLANLTVRDQAVPLTASIVASLLSQNGINDPESVAALKQQAANLPDGATVIPVSQFPTLRLTKEQIESLSPAELKTTLFSQLTGLVYDKGLDGAVAELTSDPAAQQTLKNQAGPLGIVTKQNHDLLLRIAMVFGVISVFWLTLLILFSAGWGRLVSPGIVSLILSPIGTIAGLILVTLSSSDAVSNLPVPPSVLRALGSSLQHSYGIAAVIGGGLLALALLGKVIQLIIHRAHHETPEFLKD